MDFKARAWSSLSPLGYRDNKVPLPPLWGQSQGSGEDLSTLRDSLPLYKCGHGHFTYYTYY